MNMTTTINIETLYNFIDLIQVCIKDLQNSNDHLFKLIRYGYADGILQTISGLGLINNKQYGYIHDCIMNKVNIDGDVLGNFDNFKDGE